MCSAVKAIYLDAIILNASRTKLYSVNITSDGKQALLRLANGDMRKVLNVLQVCLLEQFACILDSAS
jgi:replication-associated recombination protein RarA